MKNKVFILILNWNGWRDTLECLDSVLNLDYPNYQIVVLDNGSADDSIEQIKSWCKDKVYCVEYDLKTAAYGGNSEEETELEHLPSNKRLVLVRSQINLGFAEGNNTALQYAIKSADPADFVFLLNNDTVIDSDCLTRAVELAQTKNIDIVTCVIKEKGTGRLLFTGDHRPSHLFYVSYYWYRHKLESDEPSNMAWGTAMMVSKNVLESIKKEGSEIFDPRLFLYGEDNEFSMRMLEKGYKIYVASRAFVYHKQNTSCVNKKYKNSFLLYYATRNTVLVARQHVQGLWRLLFHLYYPVVRLKDVLLKLLRLRYREASYILEGLWDGYRKVSGKWQKHV